ncbi:cyclic pyranopterin monophosphate synthase [Chitinimonas naiadis]
MSDLTHFNERGQAHMVDVGQKPGTVRRAIARGFLSASAECLSKIRLGQHGKGDVLGVARIAGIMAAKRCSSLIPLCHPVALTHTAVDFQLSDDGVAVSATVECVGQTGVEMEALTAASIALLTIYDMCKAIDKGMCLHSLHLVEKRGGKSGLWQAAPRP